MKTLILPCMASLILLSACQTVTAAPTGQAGNSSYKAFGTEPFLSLAIEGDRMVFDRMDLPKVTARNVSARPSFNGWRYVSDSMTVDVTFGDCSDGMSDRTYKDIVTVQIGDKNHKGCGGGIAPPSRLEGTSWRVSSINGSVIPADREALFRFENERMNGTVGCNRFSAEFRYAKRNLSFSPPISTRMACPDPVGAQENAVLALLRNELTTTFPGDGTMVLSGADGGSIVLTQQV